MIKIRLEKWEKSLVFQVLDQSEYIEDDNGTIYKYGTWGIYTLNCPHLLLDKIIVRGIYAKGDFEVSSLLFSDNKQRDIAYEQIVRVFKAYNKRNDSYKEVDNENIFILN